MNLPEQGFLRLKQILGDPSKGITPLVPVSKTAWYAGVKAGYYPQPVRLGPRTAAYRVADILALRGVQK